MLKKTTDNLETIARCLYMYDAYNMKYIIINYYFINNIKYLQIIITFEGGEGLSPPSHHLIVPMSKMYKALQYCKPNNIII